ncbi:hypothetical protein T01_15819, partial [Trichinella spiralis]
LPVLKRSYCRTCLPENVCKFLFDRDALAYVALVTLIAGLRRAVRLQYVSIPLFCINGTKKKRNDGKHEAEQEKRRGKCDNFSDKDTSKGLGKTSSLEGLKRHLICDEIHLSRHAEACFD